MEQPTSKNCGVDHNISICTLIGSDGNFDGVLDLITGAGPGGGPQVNGFSFPTLDLLFSFFSGDPSSTGGVFVS